MDKNKSKEELIALIKEWIQIDSEVSKLKAEVKKKTAKKKELTDTLANVMKLNSIDCFDINGGAIVYKQKKTKKPITGKYLLAQLEEYYANEPTVAHEITQHVLANREEVVKDEIKRKVDKNKQNKDNSTIK